MEQYKPFQKNRNFYLGVGCTILEGLLSGCNFMILYLVMQMMLQKKFLLQPLLAITGLLAGIFLLRLLIYGFGYTQGQIGGAAVSKQIRLCLGEKIKKIPLSRFTQGQTGQYINTITSDVTNYEKILTHKVGDLAKNISLSLMLTVFVSTIWLPGGIIFLATDFLLIPAIWFSFRAVKKYGNRKNQISAENVSSIVEYVTGIQTFRAYGIGGTKNEAVTKAMKDFSDISYIYEANTIPPGSVLGALAWCSCPVIMLAASNPLLSGSMDLVTYLMLCMMPLFLAKLETTIYVDLTSYKNLTISKRQIVKIFNESEECGTTEPFVSQNYDIEFQDIDFSYVPGEPVLEHISLHVPNQKLTAIVGDSGSGKSTILNLIAKYYEPTSGTIAIGDKSINQVAAERVLEQISMVDQDVFLFNDTIRENIRHARPDATDEEIEAACREANCDDFIRKMEKGYDTPTGENGNLLSGGERQRLSIARAILKNSPILLLDEATASLDIENELAVKQAIVNLLKAKKTVVMIAHTLSIVKNADQILVVSGGKIAESGTHEELLAKKGKYAAMWNAEQKLSA